MPDPSSQNVNIKGRFLSLKYIFVFLLYNNLELVSEFSTDWFLDSLSRFICRRSCSSKIILDNGTNLKGAAKLLKEQFQLCRDERMKDSSSMKGIQWSFIPSHMSYFRGLWKSRIKSDKELLTKLYNSAFLNFEEMYTVFLQIEACLNSRSLTEISFDLSDFLVDSPIHQSAEP